MYKNNLKNREFDNSIVRWNLKSGIAGELGWVQPRGRGWKSLNFKASLFSEAFALGQGKGTS